MWYTLNCSGNDGTAIAARKTREFAMSKTAAVALSPSTTLFGRLLAGIDRLLMTNARIAVRNGDIPRFGL
jgi:hypothetical protein